MLHFFARKCGIIRTLRRFDCIFFYFDVKEKILYFICLFVNFNAIGTWFLCIVILIYIYLLSLVGIYIISRFLVFRLCLSMRSIPKPIAEISKSIYFKKTEIFIKIFKKIKAIIESKQNWYWVWNFVEIPIDAFRLYGEIHIFGKKSQIVTFADVVKFVLGAICTNQIDLSIIYRIFYHILGKLCSNQHGI